MSGRATAFDALMSAARAAAQCKSKPSRPPAKKRKETKRFTSRHAAKSTGEKAVVGRENPKSGGSGISPTFCETKPRDEAESASDCISAVTEEPPAEARALAVEEEPATKRARPLEAEDRRAELKMKIGNLKNRPGDFDPRSVACWEEEEKVPFLFLALAFDLISNESGRIVITDILCNMLRTIIRTTPGDLVATVNLSANRVAAAHEGVELGIGDESIIKVLAEAYGGNRAQIKKQYEEKGDLGLVAKGSRSTQMLMYKPPPLTIDKVFNTFRNIAKESGKDSQEKKKNHIKSLLVAATDCEPQYLIRLLQSKMRIGYAEQTLLAALGQAAVYTENHSKPPPHINAPLEEAAKIVKQVYSVLPVYEKVITSILTDGLWNLTMTCGITIGIPVGPMLAKPSRGVSEIIENFQGRVYTCEYKYDGQRAQIHYMEDGSIEIYSRNAERNTARFPDVAVTVTRLKKSSVNSFILDCEIVAYDRVKNRILPFQTLSTRARKDVTLTDIKVDVCIYAFDILYCNGQSLIKEQLELRRQLLYDSFEQESGYFQFATSITSNDLEEIHNFLDDALDDSCEGLIIKTLNSDATYEPSRRSNNWLKLKKDYIDKVGDSLDLVPIGAFYGRGKRSGVYGGFLIACYDPDREEFQSICKLSTGFSDALLKECFARLGSKVIPKAKSYYRYGLTVPDVWLEATEVTRTVFCNVPVSDLSKKVWEVKCADLTISAANTAAIGIVDPQKGISLRFPRLLRVRADKSPEQSTSSAQVADMFNAQKQNHPSGQAGGDEDEDAGNG